MLKDSNPVHRVNAIIRKLQELSQKLAPFYAAFDLINDQDADISSLESVPAFRTLWLEKQQLDRELSTLLLTLAVVYHEHNPQ